MASGEDTSGSNMPNDDLDVENEEKLKKQHELFQTDQTILTRTLIGRNIFQLKEGDHIGWRRIGYWHHAIYISVNEAGFEVIHFTKTKTICKKNVHKKEGNDLDKEKCDKNENDQSMNVISENIMNTNETNKELYCFNYPQTILDKNPAKIVIERAKAALREPQSYCLLRNNCEHFATYCKTGKGSKAIETTSYVSSSARAGSKAMEATSSVSRSATIGSKVMKGSSSVSSSARAGSKAMEATSSVSRSTKIGSKVMKGSSSVSRYSRNGSKTMDTANKLGRRNTFFKGVNAVSSIFTLGLIAHNEVQATRKDFEKYKQVFDKKEISKDDYNRLCQGRVTASVVGGAATFAGDYFGFKAGGILGAKIGAFGGAVGATVGAVIGGFGGCCLGYMMGQSVGEKILPVIPDNTRDVQYLHDVDESDSWRFTDEPGSWRDLMKRRGPPHPYSPIHIDIQTTDLTCESIDQENALLENIHGMVYYTRYLHDVDESDSWRFTDEPGSWRDLMKRRGPPHPYSPIHIDIQTTDLNDAQRRNGITMDSNKVMKKNGEVVEFKTWTKASADFLKWLKRRERPVLVSKKCGPLSLRVLIAAYESIDQGNALRENIHGMVYYTRYLHDVDESDSWRFTDEPGSWQNLMKVGVSPPPYSPIHIDIQTTDLIYASDGHIPQITQLVAVDETSKPFQCYIRPVIPISDDAQRRNGITMDSNKVMRMNGEVVEFQTWTKASADFLEWLKRLDRPVLVSKKFGHISFMILISAYERIGQKNALLENIHGMVYYTSKNEHNAELYIT
ncbi:hypothetical protein MAR_034838 [Mya arenaria]|uniref:LRAT domain-containing protein n=1 Tax=Mya arenaria TaxID=6604 RepID=A0ABY7ELB6_MYAAR|nr:hypothetical protein MAR_034838 [Mya arenaria]